MSLPGSTRDAVSLIKVAPKYEPGRERLEIIELARQRRCGIGNTRADRSVDPSIQPTPCAPSEAAGNIFSMNGAKSDRIDHKPAAVLIESRARARTCVSPPRGGGERGGGWFTARRGSESGIETSARRLAAQGERKGNRLRTGRGSRSRCRILSKLGQHAVRLSDRPRFIALGVPDAQQRTLPSLPWWWWW